MRRKHNRYADEKACRNLCVKALNDLDYYQFELTVVAHDAKIHGVPKDTIARLAKAGSYMSAAMDILEDVCGDDENGFSSDKAEEVVAIEETEECDA